MRRRLKVLLFSAKQTLIELLLLLLLLSLQTTRNVYMTNPHAHHAQPFLRTALLKQQLQFALATLPFHTL
jgi:hypothetical protein